MKIKFLLFILFPLTNLYPQFNSDTLISPAVTADSLRRDSTAADTTALLSDSLKMTRKDSLAAIHQLPFYPGSFFISNNEMMFTDYRYSADFLELFPFTFVLDQGFVGQPSEVLVYGAGVNSVSYFKDGVFINNRYLNSFDLNNISSESIDSIEIIPAPRGFLYGPINNLVSVNFLSKDFIPKAPYSRIKYYEGPSGEAMFDGIFSAMLFKKLSFNADITNRKTEENEGFENSGFSIWQASAKLKYFLSEKINLTGTYTFVHSEKGINGGVDADSIRRSTSNVDSILYDENLAPVVEPDAHQKIKQHHFGLRMFWKPGGNLKTDLNFYYKFYLDELTGFQNYQSEYYWPGGVNVVETYVKNKIWGGSLRQNFSTRTKIGILNAQVNMNYEYRDFLYREKIELDSFSVPNANSYPKTDFSIFPVVSFLSLDSSFVISAFYKFKKTYITDIALMDQDGAGIDLFYKIKSTTFYLGYSEFHPNFKDVVSTTELGINLFYFNSRFDLRIFKRNSPKIFPISYGTPELTELDAVKDLWGIGLKGSVNIWKLGLDFQSFYNLPDNGDKKEFQFRGGIFYKNVLFDSSLNLKTGFNFYYFGKHTLFTKNFENITVNSASRIDFTLAGEIQKSAIAYFAWENLLDEDYYIVPYYPMPGRSIRFGIAWEIFN